MENYNSTGKRKKICFIVQRYGVEVNGGAELLLRQYAERLSKYYEVEVLTSCARDYYTWENLYEAGETEINKVKVLRFEALKKRELRSFEQKSGKVYTNLYNDIEACASWFKESGPYCPGMNQYILEHKNTYDVFVFMGYLYYTTTLCLPNIAKKAVLIPTAHDDIALNTINFYRALFRLPGGFVYLTDVEKNLVHERFHNEMIPSVITGVGIDLPDRQVLAKNSIRKKYKIYDDYIVYVGRIDVSKGCQDLIDYFIAYKKAYPGLLKLLLVGGSFMQTSQNDDIIELGFISEEEKFAAIAEAKALVLPSRLESLGIVVLEAMKLGVPVLLSAHSDVLREQANRSDAGLYFYGEEDFKQTLYLLLTDRHLSKKMGANGIRYVESRYRWDIIEKKLCGIIDKVAGDGLE